MVKSTINGVIIKKLVRHTDKRGFFSEIIRQSDPIFRTQFAQISHSLARTGVLKAWHLHRKQTDWMYVALGEIHLALNDTRKRSSTYKQMMEIPLGDTIPLQVVRIPPGIAHGYKVTRGPMHIIYIADREYDPGDIEIIPDDDPVIGFDWNLLKRRNNDREQT